MKRSRKKTTRRLEGGGGGMGGENEEKNYLDDKRVPHLLHGVVIFMYEFIDFLP